MSFFKKIKIFLIILSLAVNNFLMAQNLSPNNIDDRYLYISFKKNNDKLIIALDGYLIVNGRKYLTNELNYEWKINLGNNYDKVKTYQPLISLEDIGNNLSGVITIIAKDLSFSFDKSFIFNNKNLPRAVIAKYDREKNIALPLNRLSQKEVLYPLTYYFTSNNLAYVWTINDTDYYNSFLLDISSLSGKIKINLRVYNLDNSQEVAFDEVIIEK
jgi:hypothetical protein